jgi:hypothetical protein
MAILTAVACIVEIGDLLHLNRSPSNIYDKVDGAIGVYSNEMLKDLKINATVIGAKELGTCDPKERICTGVRGLLESGEADFSLTMMETTGLPPRHCYPHDYGPVLQASETFILQTPDQNASEQIAGVFTLIMDISPICVITLFATYVAAMLLINLKLGTAGIYLMKHYTFFDVWRHVMNRPYKTFKSIPRRITLMVMLLLQLWTYQTMMATAKGDLTIVTPAVYLKTLQEIADSNRSVYVNPGTVTDVHFSTSNNPIERKIRKRLVRANKSPIIASIGLRSQLEGMRQMCQVKDSPCHQNISHLQQTYKSLSKAICFHDESVSACNYAGWLCKMNANKPDIDYRFTRYILPNQNFGRTFGMSRNISDVLRKRISFTLFSLFEHGFTNLPMTPSRVIDPSGVLDLGQMLACFEHVLGMKSGRSEHVHDLPLSAYFNFLKVISICFAVSAIILIVEEIFHRRQEKCQGEAWKFPELSLHY